MDRVCESADFAGWPFRVGVAHGPSVEPEEVGSGQGQRHGEICGVGFVGIVAWIQFRYRRSAARGTLQTTVTQLITFVSVVVRVYTTARWLGKTLNISETSYEFSELTAPAMGL